MNIEKKYLYVHMRQSDPWFRFWEHAGWHKIEFEKNLSARISKSIFGSIIIIDKAKNISGKTLQKIEQFAKNQKTLYIYIKPGLSQDEEILNKNNYILLNRAIDITKTGIIDLISPLDSLYKRLSYRVRHLLKLSKDKIVVNITNDYSDFDIENFYTIYQENGHTKKFPTFRKTEFYNFMKEFKNNCYLCIVTNNEGEYLGGCVFTFENKTAWYMFSAVTKGGRESAIGYAMLWNGIIFLKNKGFEFLDLEGLRDERYAKLNSCQQGFTEFKEHFHPQVIYYPKVRVKYYNKIFKLLNFI